MTVRKTMGIAIMTSDCLAATHCLAIPPTQSDQVSSDDVGYY